MLYDIFVPSIFYAQSNWEKIVEKKKENSSDDGSHNELSKTPKII